jgi:hypothetical protein
MSSLSLLSCLPTRHKNRDSWLACVYEVLVLNLSECLVTSRSGRVDDLAFGVSLCEEVFQNFRNLVLLMESRSVSLSSRVGPPRRANAVKCSKAVLAC